MLICAICGEEDPEDLFWVNVEEMRKDLWVGLHLECLLDVKRGVGA